ncbi:MAG TPA: hypothetical protein VEY07_00085 [Thermoplasmata archaeon]|nr:hypothetical protein [Thermoplasmata archaeon]
MRSTVGSRRPRFAPLRRLGYGAAVLVVSDLLLGIIVFSVAVLGLVATFSVFWIELAGQAAGVGAQFGTATQLDSAYALLGVVPPFMALTLYLGVAAFRIPRTIWVTRVRPKGRPRAS